MALVLLLLSAILPASAVAQGAPNGRLGKPSAKDQVIEAVRGEAIQITLETEAKSPNAKVEFVVKDVPYYGTLSGLPRIDPRTPTKAVITYQSDPKSTAAADTIAWYARYPPNGYYSTPGRVVIRLTDPAPVLKLSEQIYFGRTVIGRESVRELHVENVGNATFQQTFELQPPWHMIEPANGQVTVKPGDKTVLEVAFRPNQQGSIVYQLKFVPGKGGQSILNGDAYLPFKTDPPAVTLAYQPETRVRSAEISLYGLAPENVMVAVHTDGRLTSTAGGRILVRSGDKHTIRFALPVADAQAYEGFVTLAAEGYSEQVRVAAAPTPALLEVEMPDGSTTINFGEVVPGILLSRAFRLINRGGSEAVVRLELPPPFELISRDASNVIPPQSSRDYTVVFHSEEGAASALHRESLTIHSADTEQSFAVSAVVKAPVAVSAAVPGSRLPPFTGDGAASNPLPQLRPPGSGSGGGTTMALPLPIPPPRADSEDEDRKLRTPMGTLTTDYEVREYSNRIQPVPKFDLLERHRTSLVIGWPLPSPSQRQFVVDMRHTRQNMETFAIDSVWLPWQDVEFDISKEGQVRATILGLRPGTIFEFRVLSVTDDGRYSPPSEPLGILTAAPIDWTWFKRIVIFCGIALAGWIGWRIHVFRQA